jgi:hypothetical protein
MIISASANYASMPPDGRCNCIPAAPLGEASAHTEGTMIALLAIAGVAAAVTIYGMGKPKKALSGARGRR